MLLPEYRSAEKGACDSCGAEGVTVYDVEVASDGWQCATCVLSAEPADLDLTDADDLARRYGVALAALTSERARAEQREKELEATQQTICEILSEFSSEMRYVPHDQEQRWRKVAGLSEIKA
jgi:hypothetical protein